MDPDAAAAKQAVGFTGQLNERIVPVAPVLTVLPPALMNRSVMVSNMEAGFQHQGNGKLADGVPAVIGDVAHRDPLFFGAGNVHHVVAGGRHGNQLQVRAALQNPPGHRGLIDDGDLCAVQPADHLILVIQSDPIINSHVPQRLQRRPAQIAGIFRISVQYYNFHRIPPFHAKGQIFSSPL